MATLRSSASNGFLEQMQPSRPQKLLSQLGKDYPKIWKIVDDMVSERGNSLPKWADWCFPPLAFILERPKRLP